jgi:prepilin-type N-terminal cleavage/methylation domain-containing protein
MGFTLIELMIVTAIIATLAALAVPMYSEYVKRAKIARAIAEIHTVQTEISALKLMGVSHRRI